MPLEPPSAATADDREVLESAWHRCSLLSVPAFLGEKDVIEECLHGDLSTLQSASTLAPFEHRLAPYGLKQFHEWLQSTSYFCFST